LLSAALVASMVGGCAEPGPPEAVVITVTPPVLEDKATPPEPVVPPAPEELSQEELENIADGGGSSGGSSGNGNSSGSTGTGTGTGSGGSSSGPRNLRPRIDRLLPANLPTATAGHLPGLVAVPKNTLTAGYAKPGDEKPSVTLTSMTDTAIAPLRARWTVVDTIGDEWLAVLVPVGRRALPSQNRALVNHAMAWVHTRDVYLGGESTRINISTGNRTLTVVKNGAAVATFPVGVGKASTPTPKGLCSVIGHVKTMDGGPQLLTSCQSEAMNTWMGYKWAATAIHTSLNGGRDVGVAISNGCVRVREADYKKYLTDIPVGTPIVIT
jgi:hypothetical protein